MEKKQALYLLRNKKNLDFKIGISIDACARASALPQDINFDQSYHVECFGLSARRVEQTIHAFFHKFRANDYEGEGKTEWFKGECFEEVKAFLMTYSDRLGCSQPKPLPSRQHVGSTIKTQIRLSRREQYQRSLEEWESKRSAAIRHCDVVFRQCLNILQMTVAQGALLGRGWMDNSHWHSDKDFLAFNTSPETEVWHKCIRADKDNQAKAFEPYIMLYPIKFKEGSIGFCMSKYSMLGLSTSNNDGLWHTFNRPKTEHIEEAAILEEWNAFLDSIPILRQIDLADGRKRLESAHANLWGAWNN